MCRIILTLLITCTLFLFGHAQEFQWEVSPNIEGYDEININNQIVNFIVVKKDGKYGVISPKKKQILPIEYKKIDQVTEDHFSAWHFEKKADGKINTFYDAKGRAMDFKNEIQPVFRAKKREEEKELTDKTAAGIEKIWPGTRFKPGENERSTDVILSNGDTLLTNAYLKNSNVIFNTYLVYQIPAGGGYAMIDKDRNVILQNNKLRVRETDMGHAIVDDKILIDQNGKIHFEAYKKVRALFKVPYYNVEVEEGKFLVFDENLEQVFDVPYSNTYAHEVDDNVFIVAKEGQQTMIYDAETKQIHTEPFELKSVRGGEKHIYGFKKDGFSGFYSLKSKSIVLPAIYPEVKQLSDKFFLVSKFKREKNADNPPIERKILDSNGQEIYSGVCKGISMIDRKYFRILHSDESVTILDQEMNEKMKIEIDQKINFRDGWIRVVEDGKETVYPTEKYLNGDKSISFDYYPKAIKAKDQFIAIYQVSKNKKIGFCDKAGSLIHPCELDEIGKMEDYSKVYKGYFTAKKNGSWGVLVRPSN